jgi:Domain of unknown function (DUF5666)
MLSQRLRYPILISAFIAGLAACGGGTQVAGGGIGGTGISQGSITAFGSVWVNGVEFDTTNAAITRDGAMVAQSDLAVGMVVTVDGSINSDGVSGTATRVSYAKELLGPINSKPNSNTLIVLGQTVIVDDLTKIIVNGTSATFSDLMAGDTVEVSGFLTANGIHASYIEVKSAGDQVEIKGVVTTTAVNGNANIIAIGSQDIDVSAAPSYTPTVNDYVEVKATVPTSGTALQAISVMKKSRGLGTGTSEQAEFEGFVTSVTSSSDFMVDGQEVQTTSQTIFSGGTASDIGVGTRLEIKGALSSGILIATRISFEDKLSLEGNIKSYDPTTNTVILDTYPDIPIRINDVLTEGASAPFQTGDFVKIRGRQPDSNCTPSSCVLATEVDHVTSGGSGGGGGGGSMPIESHVIVDAVDNRTITIWGQTLDVSTISSFSGKDSAGNEIVTMTQFLAAVKPGDLVDLKGTNTNGTVTWESIELED